MVSGLVPVPGKGDVLVYVCWVHSAMISRAYHASTVGNVYKPSSQGLRMQYYERFACLEREGVFAKSR